MLGIDKAKPILRASIDGLNQGKFTEGHELDRKWQVPKEMVGRRLTGSLRGLRPRLSSSRRDRFETGIVLVRC
jgi:hypothetical protein